MSMTTQMGAMIQDINASTQAQFIKPYAVDLVLGMDPTGQGKNKPVSPVQVKLYENKETISKGGDSLKWAARETLPTTKTVNPYESYTRSRTPGLMSFSVEWSLLVTPFPLYGMDAILNTGKQAMVDLYMDRLMAAFRSHQCEIMKHFYGDGKQSWDPTLETPALANFTIEEDGVSAVGLGFGNSSETDAILGKTNTIYGKSRSTKPRLAASPLDVTSATDMSTAGAVASGYISNLTIEHFRRGIAKARKMGVNPDIGTCGYLVYDQVKRLANAKGIITENSVDKNLMKFGFDNFMIDGVPITPDDFCYPLQVNFFDTRNTRIVFCAGEEPNLSAPVPDPSAGWRVTQQEISSLYQIVSYDPSRNSCLYNLVEG